MLRNLNVVIVQCAFSINVSHRNFPANLIHIDINNWIHVIKLSANRLGFSSLALTFRCATMEPNCTNFIPNAIKSANIVCVVLVMNCEYQSLRHVCHTEIAAAINFVVSLRTFGIELIYIL